MSDIARKVAQYLLKADAVRLNPGNPFTWASGLKSPIYCDNRKILSFPEYRTEIKNHLSELSDILGDAEVIAGVATAGIPHGVLVADVKNLPFIYVRSKAKGHGLQSRIEGRYLEGQKVVVTEDLISTGRSSLDAVDSLREAGLNVLGVIALFSYGLEEAQDNFNKADCQLATLSNYGTLIEVALEQKMISEEDLFLLKEWKANPKNWLKED